MKPFLLLSVCLVSIAASSQKFAVSPRFSVNTAAGEQVGKFKNAYSLGGSAEMGLRNASPVKLVLQADVGMNGYRSLPYQFSYGSTVTNTDIQYSSSVVQVVGGLRYVVNQGKRLSGYAGAGAGVLAYSTNYYIEDPRDADGCRALEARNIHRDLSFMGRAEAGLRWLTGWRAAPGRRIAIEAGAGHLRGTNASFIRLGRTNDPGRSVNETAKFQTPTNEVHEHSIGRRYTTAVQQWVYHIGLYIPL